MKQFILHTLKGSSMVFYKIITADSFIIQSRHIKVIRDNIQISHFPARYFSIEKLDTE